MTSKKTKKEAPPVERRAYRVREFNEAFGFSNSKTYQLMREGKLKSVFVGGVRLIPVDAAEALLRGAEP